MKGKDGREYELVLREGKDGFTPFELIDKKTGQKTDDGWLVISKNGVLRVDRV